jgi:hypothetical protein
MTMKFLNARPVALSIVLGMLGAAVLSAGVEPVSRLDAARLRAKIDKINKNVSGLRSAVPLRTQVSEAELNSYLQYEMGDQLPAGVKDPWVSILGNNHVSGRATVDLSQISQSHKNGGMMDPYSYLTGSLPIAADGVLVSKNGVATLTLESASISGVPVPVSMLQEIVSRYSKSPDTPEGVSLAKPFPLPAGIREIQLAPGQATVIQ